jgi:hypothetical protein
MKHGVPCDFEHPEAVGEIRAAVTAASADGPVHGAAAPLTPSTASDPAKSPPFEVGASPAVASAALLHRPPPSPAVSATTPASHRMLELRLMHQYTALTCKTFTFTAPVTEDVWKIDVPHLAFSGSQHLTDAVLAVAALHLRSQSPGDKTLIRASHAYMAACLAEYGASLTRGINESNAEALFLTATLISFQSTATRVFLKDESSSAGYNYDAGDGRDRGPRAGSYAIPVSWFHSFQGVKAITAASWPHLRHSPVVTHIINSQAVLQLDFSGGGTFFGHLLDGLEEELTAPEPDFDDSQAAADGASRGSQAPLRSGGRSPDEALVDRTRRAYQHAVAVLNWAHKIPHKGAPLAFPATVSRRFVEMLELQRPRALAILACFFALLKSLDNVWWLHGMARREVLGIASLFNGDYFGPDAYRRWWPHLEWAMRIALWDDKNGLIPAHIWGADWLAEEADLEEKQMGSNYVSHIEMLSRMESPCQSLPSVPDP